MNRIIIPNVVTSLNILCGTLAIYITLSTPEDIYKASFLIFLASIFDFLDGFLARLLKAQSEFGKQMDSFADLVSFGLAPTFLIFTLLKSSTDSKILPFAAFIIIVLSALRLAKFNITNQKIKFSGMPTPALAIFAASLPLIFWAHSNETHTFLSVLHNKYFLLTATIIMSLLLVSKIEMLSLKFSNFKIRENIARYTLLLISVILFIILRWLAVPVIIITYIIVSLADNLIHKLSSSKS